MKDMVCRRWVFNMWIIDIFENKIKGIKKKLKIEKNFFKRKKDWYFIEKENL